MTLGVMLMWVNGDEKRGQDLFLASFVVVVVDELLEFLAVFLCELVLFVVLVLVVEDVREEVLDGFALGVAHGEHGCVCALGQQLVREVLPLAVALVDTVNFPEVDVIEKLPARYSYLAHE